MLGRNKHQQTTLCSRARCYTKGTGYSLNWLRKAPHERGTFFRFQVYERLGISLVEVYEKDREICHFGL